MTAALLLALGISALTAILFALSPALRSSRTDAIGVFNGGRTSTRRMMAGNFIVVVALASVVSSVTIMSAVAVAPAVYRAASMDPASALRSE